MDKLGFRLLASYLVWSLVFRVGAGIADFFWVMFFGDRLSISDVLLVSLPAMMPGGLYFKRTGELPKPAYSWKFATIFLVATLVVFGPFTIWYLAETGLMSAELAQPPTLYILILVFVVSFLGLRFSFALGARSEASRVARLQAKAARQNGS